MMPGLRSKIANEVPRNSKMEAIVSVWIAYTTENMIAKEISALVAESLNDRHPTMCK